MEAEERPIVFFDGVCGLCNRAVDILLRIDRRGVLLFAPLQGETARALLPPELVEDLETLVFRVRGENYTRSRAVLHILGEIGGLWKPFGILAGLPPALGDTLYRFVARHRIQWFGSKETCRLPTPEEQGRFLP